MSVRKLIEPLERAVRPHGCRRCGSQRQTLNHEGSKPRSRADGSMGLPANHDSPGWRTRSFVSSDLRGSESRTRAHSRTGRDRAAARPAVIPAARKIDPWRAFPRVMAGEGAPSMTCFLAASKSWIPAFVGMTGVVAPPKSRSFGRLVVRRETGKE